MNTELVVRVGAEIRRLRKAQRKTQEDLASQVDVDPKTISRIESGRVLPSLELLDRLRAVLGASWSELLVQDEEAAAAAIRDRILRHVVVADLKRLKAIETMLGLS